MHCEQLIAAFDDCFLETFNTRLVGGAEEPLYLPSTKTLPARIFFRSDYVSSALHEISHWCIAGEKRRDQEDYGYWYETDTRDEANEQLVSLDGAAAQITHQLATPIANLQLLFEELLEEQPNNIIVKQMQTPLEQCREQLNSFRALSEQIRVNNAKDQITITQLQTAINDTFVLQYPGQHIKWSTPSINAILLSDAMLLPAILNLLQNAAIANQKQGKTELELSWELNQQDQCIDLLIRDFGDGFTSSQLAELGGQVMPSEQGMGLAVLLSNVTFERLNGSLTLFNHKEGGAVAKVQLAIINSEQAAQ